MFISQNQSWNPNNYVDQMVLLNFRSSGRCNTKKKSLAGERWQDNGLIFPSNIGTPMDHSNLVKASNGSLNVLV
jgi:hypothetical protein